MIAMTIATFTGVNVNKMLLSLPAACRNLSDWTYSDQVYNDSKSPAAAGVAPDQRQLMERRPGTETGTRVNVNKQPTGLSGVRSRVAARQSVASGPWPVVRVGAKAASQKAIPIGPG